MQECTVGRVAGVDLVPKIKKQRWKIADDDISLQAVHHPRRIYVYIKDIQDALWKIAGKKMIGRAYSIPQGSIRAPGKAAAARVAAWW